MKKTLLYSILFLTTFLVTSCVQPFDEIEKIRVKGEYVLDLSVTCTAPLSKAKVDDKPGEDRYNENAVKNVYWFIFVPGNTPQFCDRDYNDDFTQTDGVFKLDGPIAMDNLVREYNTTTFLVYTIANLPSDLKSTLDAIEDDDITLEGIQDLVLTADFNKNPFAAQTSFVMQGSDVVTLTANNPNAVKVDLKRVAAKITINMNVIPAFDQMKTLATGEQEYQKTWYPDISTVQVYLSFANKDIPLKADPIEYSQEHFFTYNRYAFKKYFSYTGNSSSSSETVPSGQNIPDYSDEDWKWIVTGSPFYSYPMKWKSDSPQAPFLKVILNWSSYEEKPKKDDHGNIVHDEQGHIIYERKKATPGGDVDKPFYYKIPINPSKSPEEVYYSLNANDWYEFTFDVAILGSTADELPVILAGRYYAVDWNDPGISGGGSLDQSSYLNLASKSKVFYIYGDDGIKIPVLSSHELDGGDNGTRIISAKYWNGKSFRDTTRGSVHVSGRSTVEFENTLTNTIGAKLDCYRLEFEVEIVNKAGLRETITIIQYPPIYIDSKDGGNAMVDGYYGNVNDRWRRYKNSANGGVNIGTGEVTNKPNNDDNASRTYTPYAPITQWASRMKTMTVISISSLSNVPTYDLPDDAGDDIRYIIADPRKESGYTSSDLIAHYVEGEGQVSWDTDIAKAIKIGNPDVPNFIAPKILVASRWSRMGNWDDHNYNTDFVTAQKRCATYQENGYPAGRWRLPTEAEIMFMVNLQSYGLIDRLFTTGWSITASGSVIRVENNNTTHYRASVLNAPSTPSCRCVYDLWYWGEKPAEGAEDKYTIKVDY